MSNKKQLQQNNADLATALDNINGLPIADDVKHGLYIWARYRYTPPVVNRDMTMTITQTYAEIIISNPSFALPETDYMFFDGFVNSSGSAPKFYKEGDNLKFETKSGTVADVSSYSKGDCKIILKSSGNTSDNGVYSMICHEKTISDAKKDFIEYLVSDNPGKYPDDGEQDGYYYKKIHAENSTEYGIFANKLDEAGNIIDAVIKLKDVPENFMRREGGYSEFIDFKNIEINADRINRRAFLYCFSRPHKSGAKIKINCTSIGYNSFNNVASGISDPIMSVWISQKCLTIDASNYSYSPFASSSYTTKLYCEALSKPSGWGEYWNNYNANSKLTVVWGVTESEFDTL